VKASYSKRALQQIDEALGYVSRQSPARAAKIEARLAAMVMLAQIQPFVGLKTKVPEVRRAFLTPYPYLIDYQVREDEIVVLRFRHTSRNSAWIPGRA
jgi:plasmid stabilization system protein ParE